MLKKDRRVWKVALPFVSAACLAWRCGLSHVTFVVDVFVFLVAWVNLSRSVQACDLANSIKCQVFFLCLSSSLILSRVEKEWDEGNWDDRGRQRENVSIFDFLGGM